VGFVRREFMRTVSSEEDYFFFSRKVGRIVLRFRKTSKANRRALSLSLSISIYPSSLALVAVERFEKKYHRKKKKKKKKKKFIVVGERHAHKKKSLLSARMQLNGC